MNENTIQTNSTQIKTLLFLVTGFPPDVSGVSLFNWERAVWLSQQGLYRVVILAPDWQMSALERQYPNVIGDNLIIDVYPSQPWLPYRLTHVPKWQSAKYIENQIYYYQPDMIVMTDVERLFLLSTWRIPGKAYARQKCIPLIAEYHTDLYNFSAAYPGWQWLRSFVHRTQLTNYLYRQFDLTLCTSQAAKESCGEMGITNIQFLPFLGVDLSIYHPSRRDRVSLQPWLQPHEQDHTVLLFLGRLGYEKRVDLLITAFAQIKQKHPQFSLLIAGDGPTEVVKKLQVQAAGIGDIHFTGFLLDDQKARVMAACDIFCSPSPYETFGRTIIEAMASGLPVVTVASGAIAEYIHCGVNGYLVAANDVMALQQMIQQVATQPQSAIIDRARQDAQQFSIDHGCQQLSNFYQQILADYRAVPIVSKLRKLNFNEEALEILNLHGGACNVVTISKVEGKLDEKIVRQALDFIQEELVFLKCRIEQVSDQLYFTTAGTEKICLQVINHRANNNYLDTVKEELNKPISSNKALMRCLVVYEEKALNYCYLITTIHHAICDAISCVNLHSQILSSCQKINEKEPLNHNYTKILGSWAEFMPQYVSGISGKINTLLFIAKTSVKVWFYQPKKLKQDQYLPLKQRECGTTQRKLDSIVTKKLVVASRQELITVQPVICAAMLIAVANQIKKEQKLHTTINVSCRSYVDLRRRIHPSIPSNQLGCLASSLTCFHSLSSSILFWDLARECSQKIKRELQEESYFPAFTLFRKRIVEHYLKKPDDYPLTLDVSNIGDLKIKKDYGSFQLKEISFIPSNPIFGRIITVAVSTFNDQMLLNFVASLPSVSQVTLESIANDVIDCLITELADKKYDPP